MTVDRRKLSRVLVWYVGVPVGLLGLVAGLAVGYVTWRRGEVARRSQAYPADRGANGASAPGPSKRRDAPVAVSVEKWLPIVTAAAEKLGIRLPMPSSPDPSDRVIITRDRLEGTTRFQIDAHCLDWVACIDEKTAKVCYYHNSGLEGLVSQRWQRAEGGWPAALKEGPKITEAQARAIVDRAGIPYGLAVNRQIHEFGEPEVSFRSRADVSGGRGWALHFLRQAHGFKCPDEQVRVMVQDEHATISFCNVLVSDVALPRPVVKVSPSETDAIVDRLLRRTPWEGFIRVDGYTRRPGTLRFSGPEYRHANHAYDNSGEMTYSLEFPVHLVYWVRFVADKPGKRSYYCEAYVDCKSGEVVGGDYGPYYARTHHNSTATQP